MEDDWASPWADADDRDPTEVITILDAKDAKDARSAGTDAPQPRIPNSNVAVHDDPWSTEEHEFGDASAWATSSPAVGSGVVSGVIGGSGLSEWVEPASVGVPEFVVKGTTEENVGLPSASGDAAQQPEAKKSGDWFGATDEADAWAAGSDWGDIKHEEANKLNTSKESPPAVAPEIKPLPSSDQLTGDVNGEGSVYVDKQEDKIGASDNKQAEIEIEARGKKETIASDIISIETPLTPETAPATNPTPEIEKEPKRGSDIVQEETRDEDEDDDDFGDFANEGDFEDVEESLTKDTLDELPPLPHTPHFKVDTPFDIDTTLLNKLYPIFTSYPEPPLIKEIIYATNSRKAWYRLSQSGTIRKDKSGDDDYVRVTWVGSVQWSTANTHSRHSSLVVGKTTGQGLTKPPFDISTTSPAESQTAPSSPLVASFGWSSFDNSQPTIESHPNSSSNSVKGDEKLPSTPYRASFHGTPSRMSSQPVTPSRSVVSHSPVASNHSSKPSHSLATTRPSSPSPQSTQRTAEATATTPIIPASMDSLFSSNPGVSMSGEQAKSTSVPVPTPNFDEWGAFENIATTVKLPSNIEANCNFDEWGAFEDPGKAAEPKPSSPVSRQGRISTLLQPLGTSEATKLATGLSEDNGWGMPAEPLQATKDTISGGLSVKLSATSELKLPVLEGQEIDGWSSSPAFAGSSISKSSLGQALAQSVPKALDESQPKPLGASSLNSQETDDWGSFDAFESSISAKPSAFALKSTHVPGEPSRKATDASGPKASGADNWGFDAFESTLTPKPKIHNQHLGSVPTYAIHSRTSSVGKAQPKAQKVDPWGSFDAFELSKPSEVPKPFEVSKPQTTNSLPRLEARSSGSGRIITTSHVTPAISKLVVNDDDDDDDWGEMVQSPVVPKGSSPFSNALPSPLNPSSRTISPAPFQNTQPQPKAPTAPSAQSTASMFDFSTFEKSPAPQKAGSNNKTTSNGNGGTDTWDLSFFDGSVSTTAATPVNVSAPMTFSNQATTTTGTTDLWDAPPPTVTGRRENAKEAEESRLVNGVVDGLPDLSYMLQ